ncbi:MAG: glycosyltransferase family 2 protein [Butyrivibrio sp.]|nr:glycosyltransferase family 2 protein [Acetatifactor muris]MCM1558915.1 glycosyltransferase family 2 protein [Butyrivibrio sp.]
MKSDISVSIVIPIYNVCPEYFDRCMGSVLHQTYTNLEVILVDDGSVPQIADLCDLYAEKDHRVRVIHQNNQGVSIARNNGTRAAGGEFVMYVDADDEIADFCVAEALEAMTATNADVVIGGVQCVKDDRNFRPSAINSLSCECLIGEDKNLLRKHYLHTGKKEYKKVGGKGSYTRGPIARLIKAGLAKKVEFPIKIEYSEDCVWNFRLLDCCKKVCLVHNIWYKYRRVEDLSKSKYYSRNRAEIMANYIGLLCEENKVFLETHRKELNADIVFCLYYIAKDNLLASQCPLSNGQKRKYIWQLLREKPWNMLVNRKTRVFLPYKFYLMKILLQTGLWIPVLTAIQKKE